MTHLPRPPERPRASPWPFVGMIGMACVLFLIGASLLATPWWVVGALVVVWVVGLVVAGSWWSRRPSWVPWVPLVVAVVWFGTVAGGAAVLGWEV